MATVRVNFSKREGDLLSEIVAKYSSILESKKTDHVTNDDKNTCWETVAREFNSLNGDHSHRSIDSLKAKFKNMKAVAKKKYADEATYVAGTGGGRPRNFEITETDQRIKEIMGISLTGLEGDVANLDEDFDFSSRITATELHGIDEEEEIERLEDEIQTVVVTPGSNRNNITLQELIPSTSYIHCAPSTSYNNCAPSTSYNNCAPSTSYNNCAPSISYNNCAASSTSKKKIYNTPSLRQPKSAALQKNRTDTNEVQKSPCEVQIQDNDKTNKTPVSSKRQRMYENKISAWAAGKAELSALQKETYQEKMAQEHRFREEHHKMKMRYESALYEAQLKELHDRIKLQADKHALEMEVLRKKTCEM